MVPHHLLHFLWRVMTSIGPYKLDWSGYFFSKDVYYNRHLTELWTDGYGGVVYLDSFDRYASRVEKRVAASLTYTCSDVVGFGNQSSVPGQEKFQWIVSDFSRFGGVFLGHCFTC